jgi:hypothetical protein
MATGLTGFKTQSSYDLIIIMLSLIFQRAELANRALLAAFPLAEKPEWRRILPCATRPVSFDTLRGVVLPASEYAVTRPSN